MSANLTVVLVLALILGFLAFVAWLDRRYPRNRDRGQARGGDQ